MLSTPRKSAWVCLLTIVMLVSLGLVMFQPEKVVIAQTNSSAAELPLNAGVWNDGQAALWDLNVIDHYRWSGHPENARGFKPKQPILFSHKIHVGQNKIDCQYCHWNVAKSAFATIPEVDLCMGCHKELGGIAGSEQWMKDEINKLRDYSKKGEPIPWVKVHVIPDHVRFSHKRHVKAGVTCQSCHGQIPEMEEVQRQSSMKMGWCLSCHRNQGTSIDCTTCHK